MIREINVKFSVLLVIILSLLAWNKKRFQSAKIKVMVCLQLCELLPADVGLEHINMTWHLVTTQRALNLC